MLKHLNSHNHELRNSENNLFHIVSQISNRFYELVYLFTLFFIILYNPANAAILNKPIIPFIQIRPVLSLWQVLPLSPVSTTRVDGPS